MPLPSARAAWLLDYQGAVQAEGGGLVRPVSLYLDESRGEICVTDEGSSSFQIYNDHGLQIFHSAASLRLSLPQGTLVDARGDFLLTDGAGGQVGRVLRRLNWMGEDTGVHFQSPREGWRPESLAFTAEGDVLSLDAQNRILALHAPDGELLWSRDITGEFGEGRAPVENMVLGEIAVAPDGRIFLPVPSESCVYVLDAKGRRETVFGVQGSRAGQMAFPAAVAFGPGDRVLVLDRVRHRLLVFDPELRFEVEFLSFGAGPGQIYYPSCLAADASGRVLVGQGFQGRVQIYELSNTAWDPSESSGNGVGAIGPAVTGNLGD